MDNSTMDLYTTMPSSPSLFTCLDEGVDFTLGAKCSPFLHPATLTNSDNVTTANYDLPEWMEGREIVGLSSDNLPPATTTTTTNIMDSNFVPLDESYCQTIKPEDMLVPLSQYQQPCTPASPTLETPADTTLPEANDYSILTPVSSIQSSPADTIQSIHPANPVIITSTNPLPVTYSTYPSPPQTPPNTITPTSVLPKIIICRKVTASTKKPKPIKVQFQIKPATKTQPQIVAKVPQVSYKPVSPSTSQYREIGNHDQVVVVPERMESGTNPIGDLSVVPYDKAGGLLDAVTEPCMQDITPEDFIDDLVKMIGDDGGELQGLQDLDDIPFDAMEMKNCMEDLLTQLETSEPDERVEEKYEVQPAASPCISESKLSSSSFESSCNTLSPPSTAYPSSSLSPTPSNFTSPLTPSSPLSPTPSETSTAYLPSPVPSVGSLSPSQSSESFFSVDEEWSPLDETHSYSKSRKAKSSRRSGGGRSRPYPEDRKERKKEQNKQAALRYRQKKKQEDDEMTEKIRFEEERQRELKGKYDGLKQELGYLKKMMREMFIARGLLSEEALKKAAMEKKQKK